MDHIITKDNKNIERLHNQDSEVIIDKIPLHMYYTTEGAHASESKTKRDIFREQSWLNERDDKNIW